MCIQTTASAGQASSNLVGSKSEAQNPTVGQVLDARIATARKHLEELCIQKAKAETAGLLDFPQSVINGLAW